MHFPFTTYLPYTTGYKQQQAKGLNIPTTKSKSRKKRIQTANVLSCIEETERFFTNYDSTSMRHSIFGNDIFMAFRIKRLYYV